MGNFLDVDPAAAAPIWRQIEDGMRRQVASGRLASGTAVPSVRDLARALRVNPATVSKAYRCLTDAGLLVVRRGEGTFVAELTAGALESERQSLLAEGAVTYIRIAVSVGANRREAIRGVEKVWDVERIEGGGGARDDE